MPGVTIEQYGYRFVQQCFRAFNGQSIMLVLFALSFLYIWLKWDREEIKAYVPYVIFLLVTIFNPFIINKFIQMFDFEQVYYRFIWLVPMLLLPAYCGAKFIVDLENKWKQILGTVAILFVIYLAGSQVSDLTNGLSSASNLYKVHDDLITASEVIEKDTDIEYPVVVFDNNLNTTARQYDAHMKLAINRDVMLTYMGVSTVSAGDMESESYINQRNIMDVVIAQQQIDVATFSASLHFFHTNYVVILTNSAVTEEYMNAAGCERIETGVDYSIYRVK